MQLCRVGQRRCCERHNRSCAAHTSRVAETADHPSEMLYPALDAKRKHIINYSNNFDDFVDHPGDIGGSR